MTDKRKGMAYISTSSFFLPIFIYLRIINFFLYLCAF